MDLRANELSLLNCPGSLPLVRHERFGGEQRSLGSLPLSLFYGRGCSWGDSWGSHRDLGSDMPHSGGGAYLTAGQWKMLGVRQLMFFHALGLWAQGPSSPALYLFSLSCKGHH